MQYYIGFMVLSNDCSIECISVTCQYIEYDIGIYVAIFIQWDSNNLTAWINWFIVDDVDQTQEFIKSVKTKPFN